MNNKDAEILRLVREFRLVTERQLKELTGRKTLWRRLPVLVQQKKVYRKKRGIYKPYVYAAYNITNRRDFDHDLMITDIHIAFYRSGLLLDWAQPQQKLKGELNEDAYFVLSVGTKELHCFIEADNSSEPDWQISDKIGRYLSYHYRTQKLFRVLFAAPSEERVMRLVRASERAVTKDANRMFLFATLPDVKRDCFGRICSVCHDEKRIHLAPRNSPLE